MTERKPRAPKKMRHDELAQLLDLLKSKGVASFEGLGIKMLFDPRAHEPSMRLYDDDGLEDAAVGEAKNELKRAQKSVDDDLFWST